MQGEDRKADEDEIQVGAVLTFPVGVSCEEVRGALSKLGIEVQSATVASFNGRYGGPVWYIP